MVSVRLPRFLSKITVKLILFLRNLPNNTGLRRYKLKVETEITSSQPPVTKTDWIFLRSETKKMPQNFFESYIDIAFFYSHTSFQGNIGFKRNQL